MFNIVFLGKKMSFSLFDIFLVIIVSQGLFLALAIQLIPQKNKTSNNVLTLILIIASIVCLGRVLAFKYHSLLLVRIGTIVDGTIYLFGPLLYLYFRRLMFKEKVAYRLGFSHYIVLCVFSIYALWIFTLNKEGIQENVKNGILPKLYFLIELLGLLSITYYTYKIRNLVSLYKNSEKSLIAYDQTIVTYAKRIIIAVSVFVALWTFSFISSYFFRYNHPIINYNVMWLSLALFMFFIGYYSLAQPEIFRVPIVLTNKKVPRERMTKDAISDLEKRLHDIMFKEEIFIESNLSLLMLSKKVETSSNNLSWYLNTVQQKTFYQYINEFRVKAFIKKVEDNEHHTKTLLAIAYDVGFNTKSTFNKSFKSIMNDTPANYIKKKSESIQLVD